MEPFLLLVLGFAFGLFVEKVLTHWEKGSIIHDVCPFCQKETDITIKQIYECSTCHTKYTDKEAFERDWENKEQERREQEREVERLRLDQREREYKEKIKDINEEFSDVRKRRNL